tara:strand:- start:70 stop:288 length:219 start_codon:yes stop_codon:yes gene_type:complete
MDGVDLVEVVRTTATPEWQYTFWTRIFTSFSWEEDWIVPVVFSLTVIVSCVIAYSIAIALGKNPLSQELIDS